MNEYSTEEEQVEAMKKWWKDNGKSVIAGLVIGLGGVLGWQGWGNYQTSLNKQAANAFGQVTSAIEMGNAESAEKQAERLVDEFGSTAYAPFSVLAQARLAIQAGDLNKAEGHLNWAMSNAPNPAFEQIARLRLARVLFEKGEHDAAMTLAQQSSKEFAGEYAALRGDIAQAKGDVPAARIAYHEALAQSISDAALVQMKLDDLDAGSKTTDTPDKS